MKTLLLFIALLLAGCHRISDPDPIEPDFEEPPIGTSFISVEYDGKRVDYVDGKKRIASQGTTFSSFSGNPNIAGLGETLKDSVTGTSWTILFYFKPDELQKNTGNFTKLFNAGTYSYLLQDKDYNPVGERGVAISTSTAVNSNSGIGNTTLILRDDRTRLFEVKKAYFYSLTHDRLIWVEGSFESWMAGDKKVKGKFRVKVQHNLG